MSGVFWTAVAGLGNLLGGALVVAQPHTRQSVLKAFVGFGAGFMLAVVIVEMLPEALELRGGVLAVLVGYLLVHLTQHALTPHFHFGEETHTEAMVSPSVGVIALVGLLPHSFFDGVAISGGFAESQRLGLLIFGAILLHKVPSGVALASIMMASGNSRRAAFWGVVGLAAASVLGALVTPLVAPLATYALPLAAGVTLYVAASNLIPESQHEHSWLVQGGIFAGVLAFFLLGMILPAH
ncbi:MAG: ZIP family metal transporter [Gemmatimonadota bacterium]